MNTFVFGLDAVFHLNIIAHHTVCQDEHVSRSTSSTQLNFSKAGLVKCPTKTKKR